MTEDHPISRRDLFRGRLHNQRPAPEDESPSRETRMRVAPVHRPPGAVEEPAFLAGCTRCGDCIAACPVDAIVLADSRYGPAAGTPVIEPAKSPCVMCEDTPCIRACEPGVLTPARPLKMGTARIVEHHCLAYTGTGCTVCSEQCPVEGAIEVVKGRPVIVEATCTGCGVCQHVCPAPYNAVIVMPEHSDRGPPGATGKLGLPVLQAGQGKVDWRRAYFGDRSLRPPGV